jgi:hypothetical protein
VPHSLLPQATDRKQGDAGLLPQCRQPVTAAAARYITGSAG